MVDFLRRKVQAVRQSARLCLMIVLAMGCTILFNGLVLGYLCTIVYEYLVDWDTTNLDRAFWNGTLAGVIVTACIVTYGTLKSLTSLYRGGASIAMSLGGKPIAELPHSSEIQRFRNVAEEMAVAFSLPTPELFLLQRESGINAFAAGYTTTRAVIGVTDGCLKRLNREQLQGVIAHEFSHIKHGDMRLNMQLTSFVNGLRQITLIAETLIEEGQKQQQYPTSRNRDDQERGSGLELILLGGLMWPIGLAGSLCAAFLVLAVGRQRELLADARAVEATRNPKGLADALRRIAGQKYGSVLQHSNVSTLSHMMFAKACGYEKSLLATHPPLATRILALDPDWDHTPLFEELEQLEAYSGAFDESVRTIGGVTLRTCDASNVGTSIEPADHGLDTLNPNLLAIVTDENAVLGTLPALILHGHRMSDRLPTYFDDPQLGTLVTSLQLLIAQVDVRCRAAMLNAVLKVVSTADITSKLRLCEVIARIEQEFSEQDWDYRVWTWLARHYAGDLPIPASKARVGNIELLAEPILEVLSFASYLDSQDSIAEFRFQRGWAQLGLEHANALPVDLLNWQDALEAVKKLAQASPRIKRDLLVALSCTFMGDGHLSLAEIGFLRFFRLQLGLVDTNALPTSSRTPLWNAGCGEGLTEFSAF